ncbi:MAG: GNAT family N-acetyltransferase [Alphaproteobacteria bacterium]|nr:GNAT family N-acetyltransferase [Alphaproteobacteria bacterium]MBV9586651.1 GNAT family N-acetyltransferase [Alphaproteobacteria bacterium]MBV9967198.1 GNAT family N-acetyltransferase [Alphaproteobacteria bacterium]
MDLPPGLRLSFEKDPSWEDREAIDEALGAYNAPFLADDRYSYFGVFVRDKDRRIQAGLVGNCYAGWLFVNLLWVHADLRRHGVGQALLAEAERHAVQFGCHSAWLDTFSFQGPQFYPKFGYREFARLDYPPGHERIFFRKRLVAE